MSETGTGTLQHRPNPVPSGAAGSVRSQSRRWRTFIAIVVAIGVLAVVGDLRLGRIDARFIGRWVNARPNDLPAECTFHRNGSSSWIVGYIGLPLTTGHGWFVRGNELILTDVPHLAWRLDLRSVQRNLKVLFNRLKDDGVVERFEILEISESTLKLKRSHPWGNSPDGVETYLKQKDHERQGDSNRNESGAP